MLRIILLLALFPGVAGAQLRPSNFQKESELRAESENISFMLNSLVSGMATDDVKELRRKSDLLKSIKNDIGEEVLLRLQLMEDLQKLQMGVQFLGRRLYGVEVGDNDGRLAVLKKISASLEKHSDPKQLGQLRQKANSSRLKGALSSLRSAIQVYYGDNEGVFPGSLAVLAEKSKYIAEIPQITPPGHNKPSSTVKLVSGVRNQEELVKQVDDTGGWIYVNDRNSKLWGNVIVNCSHKDVERDMLLYSY